MGIVTIMNYYVIEGEHTDPNDITTIIQYKQRIHGPMLRGQADALARQLVIKNIDNYYHRAWVIDDEIKDSLVLK
jgi:hypothetical protein